MRRRRADGPVAGVDEAGRGCLAGPVYAAAVILPRRHRIAGLDDSKKLGAAQRERLAQRIRQRAQAWAVAAASVEEIDRLNVLRASLLAMQRAVAQLIPAPAAVEVDGREAPSVACPVRTVVDGDATVACIMAASILAKVARDEEMRRLDLEYPGYGFAVHKGYGTRAHLAQLTALGPCALHRRSFEPVRQLRLPGLDPVTPGMARAGAA